MSSQTSVKVAYRSRLVSGRGQEHGRRLLSAAGARPVHHIAATLLLLLHLLLLLLYLLPHRQWL